MLWLASLLAIVPNALGAADLLVGLHRSERPELAAVERLLAEDPERAAELGALYLRGHLLEEAGHSEQAARAFAASLAHAPALRPYGHFRLARLEARFRHPEVAAGLLATLLHSNPPRELVSPAVRLFQQSLERGGDCQLLGPLRPLRLQTPERRLLDLSQAHCELREGRPGQARILLTRMVREGISDEAARQAAQRLMLLPWERSDRSLAIELGKVFLEHRHLEQAIACLEPAARALPDRLRSQEDFEALYNLGRSHLARGEPAEAARYFGDLARRATGGSDQAMALLQQGRALELAGEGTQALQSYVRAANAYPQGDSTASALLASLRLQWLQGDRAEALQTLEILRSRMPWGPHASRGALFVASSDLVQGRTDGVSTLLQQAAQGAGAYTEEIHYWLGRMNEARERPAAALDHYLRVLRQAPHHPLGIESRKRLEGHAMREIVDSVVAERSRSPRLEDRLVAWWLLPDGDDEARQALTLGIYQILVRDPTLRPTLALAPVSPEEWPLWRAARSRGEEKLLALGVWQEVELPTVLRHFPVREPRLALTASHRLSAAGAPAKGLRLAQMIARRIDTLIPPPMLPRPFRQALFPLAFGPAVVEQSDRFGLDPALLFALLREVSGFDPEAPGHGGAHGLARLTPATAARLAAGLGRRPPTPEELLDSELTIELGAARLGALQARMGQEHLALAAYVAGDDQALLWRSYCYTDDIAELLTKITFREARGTVGSVLESAAQYRELYPELASR